MNLVQMIYKQKLENYLKDIIKIYRLENNKGVINKYKFVLNNPSSSDDILKYYYFYKYHINNNEESFEHLKILDDNLFSKGLRQHEIRRFFNDYGSLCPNLIDKFYKIYINEDIQDKNQFIFLTRILMFNQVKNWELRCLDKFHFFNEDEEYKHRISKLINHKIGYQVLDINPPPRKNHNLITDFQKQLNRVIEYFGLIYKIEVPFDEYTVDVLIPSLDMIVEADGPEHFFPLQSQLKNKYKFRYTYLQTFYKKKIVSIPYFEWNRQDNQYLANQLLHKLIYSDYSIFDSELFNCNFDLLKPIWKFKKLRVNSGSNFFRKI